MTDEQRDVGRKAAIMLCEAFGFYAAEHVLKGEKDGMIYVTASTNAFDTFSALKEAIDEGYPALYIERPAE